MSNPLKIDQVLRAVGSALTVDTGARSLSDLVYGLRDLRPDNLSGLKVPTSSQTWGSQSVVVPTDEASTPVRRAAR